MKADYNIYIFIKLRLKHGLYPFCIISFQENYHMKRYISTTYI